MKKNLVKFSVYVVVSITFIMTVILHFFKSLDLLKCLSFIATSSEILVIIYFKFLWKIKKLNFFKIVNLNGKWDCELEYDYPEGVKHKKNTTIVIRQDLFGIQVNMDSNETNSYSIIADIEKDRDREYLVYAYKTETKFDYREHNRDQLGGVKLLINDNQNMEGEYWTNNKTLGSMKLKKRV